MALVTVEGVYENGRIELLEKPEGIESARVRVTFLPARETATNREDKEAARQRAFARMRQGIDFGGEKFNRAEIYEERM